MRACMRANIIELIAMGLCCFTISALYWLSFWRAAAPLADFMSFCLIFRSILVRIHGVSFHFKIVVCLTTAHSTMRCFQNNPNVITIHTNYYDTDTYLYMWAWAFFSFYLSTDLYGHLAPQKNARVENTWFAFCRCSVPCLYRSELM